MALRIRFFLAAWTALLLGMVGPSAVQAQCPTFLNTEAYSALPATNSTPHWFQCIGSVTADPAPFTFELTAQPASHSSVQIDWGDGVVQNVGSWNGSTPIAHNYTPSEWRTYTITVTTAACPGGAEGILPANPKIPARRSFTATTMPGVPPLTPSPKST